jgi:hypothetical protein
MPPRLAVSASYPVSGKSLAEIARPLWQRKQYFVSSAETAHGVPSPPGMAPSFPGPPST